MDRIRFIKAGNMYLTKQELEREFLAGEDTVTELMGFLQCADTSLLSAAVQGTIDLNRLASIVLAQRGRDKDGQWVGFPLAKKAHNL